MNKKNGTTEAVGRRLEDSQRQNEPGRLVAPRDDSSIYGFNSIKASEINSSRENKPWTTSHQGDINSGKILERLELIERTFLSYVQGHQQRLETRLEESKTVENAFKEEVQALKQEIYHLTSKSEE